MLDVSLNITLVLIAGLGTNAAVAFAPSLPQGRGKSALAATAGENAVRKRSASLTAATILSNVAIVPQDVFAFDAGSSLAHPKSLLPKAGDAREAVPQFVRRRHPRSLALSNARRPSSNSNRLTWPLSVVP